nr:hypothetical protein [uncultured Chloroflexus sp.]
MKQLDVCQVKRPYTTHLVPASACVDYTEPTDRPCIGDLLVAEVLSLGKHSTIESTTGQIINIFPGDILIGAFGNRYATGQYEGYVPTQWPETCDLLSIGGVCGEVVSAHSSMAAPTLLRMLGALCRADRRPLNLCSFALPAPSIAGQRTNDPSCRYGDELWQDDDRRDARTGVVAGWLPRCGRQDYRHGSR